MNYPRIIAHRCGGALAPENSLEGLRIASRLGCRGVEFDAMLTRDDVAVVMHDETLERTTSGQGPVADMAAEAFLALDAGARHHKAFSGIRPPRLREALKLCTGLRLWANVEIKPTQGRDAETGRVVATECAAAVASGCEIILSSFSMPALVAAREAAPQLRRALLLDELSADWREQMIAGGAVAIHAKGDTVLATPGFADAVRAENYRLACYTMNRRDVADRLFASGVAAVFTDRIDLWAADEM